MDADDLRQRPAGVERQHPTADRVVVAIGHSGRTVGGVHLDAHRRQRGFGERHDEVKVALPGVAFGDGHVADRKYRNLVVKNRTEPLRVADGGSAQAGEVYVECFVAFDIGITVDVDSDGPGQGPAGVEHQQESADRVIVAAGDSGRTVGSVDLGDHRRGRIGRQAYCKLKRRLSAVALQHRNIVDRQSRQLASEDYPKPLAVEDGGAARVREVYVERLIPLDVRIAVDVDSENLRQRPAGIERQHLGGDGVVVAVGHSGRTVGRVDLHSHR